MGIGDSMGGMEDKAKDALRGGKGDEAVDKLAQQADEKTGHKRTGDIDKGAASVKKALDEDEPRK